MKPVHIKEILKKIIADLEKKNEKADKQRTG